MGGALDPFKHIPNIISSYFYLEAKINAPFSLLFATRAVGISAAGRTPSNQNKLVI